MAVALTNPQRIANEATWENSQQPSDDCPHKTIRTIRSRYGLVNRCLDCREEFQIEL